eukprot:4075446-Alexandrium_andersonii.AAC.1
MYEHRGGTPSPLIRGRRAGAPLFATPILLHLRRVSPGLLPAKMPRSTQLRRGQGAPPPANNG